MTLSQWAVLLGLKLWESREEARLLIQGWDSSYTQWNIPALISEKWHDEKEVMGHSPLGGRSDG